MNAMRNTLLVSLTFAALAAPAASETSIIGQKDGKDIVTVRVDQAVRSKQALPFLPGISTKTVGSKGLSLLKVVIPPGGKAEAHIHKGHESAIYLLQGRVETRYGDHLEKSVVNVAGDFIFIPPDVPHQPVNLSDSEPAIAIVARTDGNEQENVILYLEKK
ncbi:cupin domain-containing protein [Methylocystis sp.]|uniref:cupin domain-containing protein n=1 Tax=Methylocystis sp. TaxID=1911079 RepID=UPI0025FE7A08|nr:cupin domain-containing protein [Methylocystis sp.]